MPKAEAIGYAKEHQRRTGWIAAPLMLVEVMASAMMVPERCRLPEVTLQEAWLGFSLTTLIWLSTFLLQVPQHQRLLTGDSSEIAVERLVRSNWLRTALWSVRSALLLGWLSRLSA